MRKIYYSLLALLLMMVSTTVKAQYEVNITSDPENNYYSGDQGFDVNEIASTLGLADATALQELINAGGAVYLKAADGKSNQYTGNPNEFWMNIDGVAQGSSEAGTCWYVGLSFDTDEEAGTSVVDIYMGQMPNFFKSVYTPSKMSATLYLVNGDKEVSFDVTLNVNAAPEPTLPAPETDLTKLNIVKDYSMTLNFIEGGEYEAKAFSATLDGIYDALGVAQADLDANVADYVYTQVVKAEVQNEGEDNETTIYSWDNILQIPENAAGGAWYGRYTNYNEATDQDVTLEYNAPKTWNTGGNTYYLQKMSLENSEFTIGSAGQFPGVLKAGDTDFTYIYIIAGDKAARIKVQVEVEGAQPSEDVPYSEWTKVGEQTIDVISKGTPESGKFTLDVEAIAEQLGCTSNSILFNALADESNISEEHTANNGGVWMTKEGYVVKWSGNETVRAIYAEPATSGDLSTINYGFETGNWAVGDESLVKLFFNFSGKYYLVTLNVKVLEAGEFTFNEKGTDYLTKEFIANEDGYWPDGVNTVLDLDYIKSMIGTTNFKLYTDKYVKEEGAEVGELQMSKTYTCTPYPGFWYGTTTYTTADGMSVVDNNGWGNNSVGYTYADGELTWYCPGHEEGTNYLLNMYLVNEDTGDYLRYIITVNYVTELSVPAEDVLNEQVTVAIEEDKVVDDYFDVAIDKAKVAEALGISEDLLSGVEVKYAKNPSTFETIGFNDEAFFNAAGYYDIENGVAASISEDWVVSVNLEDVALGDEDKITLRYAFEYEGKRARYTIILGTPNAVGISNITAPATAKDAWYTLTGVKVAQPTEKGIYLHGGKKVYVK